MIATLPYILLAQVYGTGTYNESGYGAITVGPVTLPVTGSGLLIIGGAALTAVGGGLGAWIWQRRARRHAA